MPRLLKSYPILLLCAFFFGSSFNVKEVAGQTYNITVKPGTLIRIAQMYGTQANKAYDMVFAFAAEGGTYNQFLGHFKAGNTGHLRDNKTRPLYVGHASIKAEYQFQLRLANELMNMGYTQANNRLLKTAASSLFGQHETVWGRKNPGKSFFLNLQAGREALLRVRDNTVK